jgi:hypothetical protein
MTVSKNVPALLEEPFEDMDRHERDMASASASSIA